MKYIYIKHDVPKYFIELDNRLTNSMYNNLGTTWEDFLDNKFVELSPSLRNFRIINPNATVEEVWNMKLDSKNRTLLDAKQEMLQKIEEYDNSPEVDSFYINGTIPAWFTPEERLLYQRSVDDAMLIDENRKLTCFIDDMEITISAKTAKLILAYIHLYADDCFVVTKRHKIAVQKLETIEEVDNYDYKSGYPQKINIKI